MAGEQPLGPLQGFNVPPQTDLMRQMMEPPAAPKNSVKTALKSFTSDLMFTLSQSLAASASAPGERGTALGIAAAIAGPSQRRMLVQQAEDEKALAAQAAEKAAAELEQTRAQTNKLETENWGLRNPPTKYREITRADGSKGWEPEVPGMQTAPVPQAPLITTTQRIGDQDVEIRTFDKPGAVVGAKAAAMKNEPAIIETIKSIYGADKYSAMSESERITAVERISAALQPYGLDLASRMALRPPTSTTPQGQLDDKQMSQAIQLSNALKGHPAYADMSDIATGMTGVTAGLDKGDGFGDITAINAFQRMVDPGATVREGDVALMQSASSFVSRILSEFPIEKLRTGAKLPDATRKSMRDLAADLYNTRAKNYNSTVGEQYKKLAAAAGVPFDLIGQDFAVNKPAPAAATAPQSYQLPNGTTVTRQPDGSYR